MNPSYEIVPDSMFPKLPYTKNDDVRKALQHVMVRPHECVRVRLDGRKGLRKIAYRMAERRRLTVSTGVRHGWLYIWRADHRVSTTQAQSFEVIGK